MRTTPLLGQLMLVAAVCRAVVAPLAKVTRRPEVSAVGLYVNAICLMSSTSSACDTTGGAADFLAVILPPRMDIRGASTLECLIDVNSFCTGPGKQRVVQFSSCSLLASAVVSNRFFCTFT